MGGTICNNQTEAFKGARSQKAKKLVPKPRGCTFNQLHCQTCPYQTWTPFRCYYQLSSGANFRSSLRPAIFFLIFLVKELYVTGTKVAPFPYLCGGEWFPLPAEFVLLGKSTPKNVWFWPTLSICYAWCVSATAMRDVLVQLISLCTLVPADIVNTADAYTQEDSEAFGLSFLATIGLDQQVGAFYMARHPHMTALEWRGLVSHVFGSALCFQTISRFERNIPSLLFYSLIMTASLRIRPIQHPAFRLHVYKHFFKD